MTSTLLFNSSLVSPPKGQVPVLLLCCVQPHEPRGCRPGQPSAFTTSSFTFESVTIVTIPDPADTYLHRVGWAVRFGTKGLAVTFASSTLHSTTNYALFMSSSFCLMCDEWCLNNSLCEGPREVQVDNKEGAARHTRRRRRKLLPQAWTTTPPL